MRSPTIGLDLKFHSRVFPVVLVIMGVYCLLKRNNINCTSHGIDSSVLENNCPSLGLYRNKPASWKRVGIDIAHPGIDKNRYDEEREKVPLHSYFGLMLFVWAWVFYSSGEIWKSMEGGFVKSLQDDKAPQNIILKNPAKCRLYMMKYLSVLALAILQLILFMMVISTVLIGKTDERIFDEDLENEKQENAQSAWIAIANGENILPTMAKCTYHKYGGSGNLQKYVGICHLDFNKNLEMIYLFCMVFSIISMVHLVLAFLHNIIVSCVNLFQILHLCLYGSYSWTEARDCLARCEMFSGKWMLLQMFLPITEMESNKTID